MQTPKSITHPDQRTLKLPSRTNRIDKTPRFQPIRRNPNLPLPRKIKRHLHPLTKPSPSPPTHPHRSPHPQAAPHQPAHTNTQHSPNHPPAYAATRESTAPPSPANPDINHAPHPTSSSPTTPQRFLHFPQPIRQLLTSLRRSYKVLNSHNYSQNQTYPPSNASLTKNFTHSSFLPSSTSQPHRQLHRHLLQRPHQQRQKTLPSKTKAKSPSAKSSSYAGHPRTRSPTFTIQAK